MITDLKTIAFAAEVNEKENFHFTQFLQSKNGKEIDEVVFELNETISREIDCTSCGNCCRSLMINVDNNDASRLADHLHLTKEVFQEKYVERSSQGNLCVMNTIPCHFLLDNKCTVYKARPTECREFPGLHEQGFTKRLFTIFMHYGRCPIIFNVVEALKEIMLRKEATVQVCDATNVD